MVALLLLPGFSFASAGDADTVQVSPARALRTYTTTRLQGTKPVIDGTLNDPCWNQGEWASKFVQWIPKEGAPPTYPTYLKVLYDDRNIYVAIRSCDAEPDKIVRKAGRRDEFNGDVVGITFDSYHDHRTGFEFDITAAGQKADCIVTNPANSDLSWNAVWNAAVGSEDSAWTAEFEIPLSQLRYSNDDVQVWGMHCWRWIDRFLEESDWEPQSSEGPGLLYLFGELHGIQGLPAARRIEVMPYTVGKLKTFPSEPGNPFADKGRSWLGNGGLDAKIGLSSNFTADITVNPDFGQVESDPSVMNLSAFETYYDEKRPFFLEGKNIFSFDFDNVNMFYSRRIGHAPTLTPGLATGQFMETPDMTSILSAVKVSGKSANGLALGVLQSLTDKEWATIQDPASRHDVAVEPYTSYSIVRLQQDFGEGNTVLGGILTATNRFIHDPQLEFINRNAYTGGIDLLHYWNDKEFYVTGMLVGSTVSGSADAMSRLQGASARYYQRVDQSYVRFDSSRTRLSGYGGQIVVGKGSKGFWRYSTELDWRSPGLELNDLGYMQTADVVKLRNSIRYFVTQPVSIFRTYSLTFTETSLWDFGMRYLNSSFQGVAYGEFLNNWALNLTFGYTPPGLDIRLLRGGPAIRVPGAWSFASYVRTDPSRRVVFDVTTDVSGSAHRNNSSFLFSPELSVTPITALRLSLSVNYNRTKNDFQYVDAPLTNGQPHYILAHLSQESFSGTFRIDCSVTPEFSIQYYGSPFASVGWYDDYKNITQPTAEGYASRFTGLSPLRTPSGQWGVFDASGPNALYAFDDPNFAFGQFRSILVFRWEYLPGSTAYLVWSHERTSYEQPVINTIGQAMHTLGSAPANNIFLMKLSYWFSI